MSMSGSAPSMSPSAPSASSSTKPVTSAVGVSTQSLLGGLANMKVDEMNLNQVGQNSFLKLNDSWNDVQVHAFLQSMQADSKATSAASALNERMQERGVLPQGQRVVGFFGGKFFTTPS
jgi:hypothetical protein